jgi:hypothetical protein
MANIKLSKINKSLILKGFKSVKSKNRNPHQFYYYIKPDGSIASHIRTYNSVHSNQDYVADNTIKDMSRQLKFKTKQDFESFVECTISKEEYYQHLVDTGNLK